MLDHHLQRTIAYRLAFTDGLRFSELKPDNVDNKLFTYHLKKVESAGLIAKNPDGAYSLTAEGRRLGVHVLDGKQALVDRPDSVLFLVVRRASDNAWLLYKRRTHPLRGLTGFMHGQPSALESSSTTAQNILQDKTGLRGRFTAIGAGYFRVFREDQLESFTHFTMLACEDATGELAPDDEHAEYFWQQSPDFSASDFLPNMSYLVEAYQTKTPFFIEKTIEL
jgi:ADP-ribose pyrophosphatase YjhB (NUDIX family)